MAPQVDTAIVEALGLDAAHTHIDTHGGSGFASTFKITSTKDGRPVHYFVKTGSGPAAEVMFRGEHASLNAIRDAVPNFAPRSYAHGPMSAEAGPDKYFMVTDFLDLGSTANKGSGLSFAEKLARLHTTPAPVPEGFDGPVFGFPVTTCCGDTPQDNSWRRSWAEFYADNRLRAILAAAIRSNGPDAELSDAVETVASRVVPRLIDRLGRIVPVVCHGDLWSGNHSRGCIGDGDGIEEVVFDPSAVYAHSEYELGIMKMFGGGGRQFWAEYEQLVPKAEPVAEWEDRVLLYELYHHLNHFTIFGGAYREGAMSIMRKLITKYGQSS